MSTGSSSALTFSGWYRLPSVASWPLRDDSWNARRRTETTTFLNQDFASLCFIALTVELWVSTGFWLLTVSGNGNLVCMAACMWRKLIQCLFPVSKSRVHKCRICIFCKRCFLAFKSFCTGKAHDSFDTGTIVEPLEFFVPPFLKPKFDSFCSTTRFGFGWYGVTWILKSTSSASPVGSISLTSPGECTSSTSPGLICCSNLCSFCLHCALIFSLILLGLGVSLALTTACCWLP